MHSATVAQLSAGLRERKFSATELAQDLLARITRAQPALNAFISIESEAALAAAAEADRRLAAGGAPPLTGVPIAHKDLFCAAGSRTTCGSRMLSNFISPYDATVVARLRAGDAPEQVPGQLGGRELARAQAGAELGDCR